MLEYDKAPSVSTVRNPNVITVKLETRNDIKDNPWSNIKSEISNLPGQTKS
jgi:hypothetical protein